VLTDLHLPSRGGFSLDIFLFSDTSSWKRIMEESTKGRTDSGSGELVDVEK
jgi:hypothetical protein